MYMLLKSKAVLISIISYFVGYIDISSGANISAAKEKTIINVCFIKGIKTSCGCCEHVITKTVVLLSV